MKQNVIWLIVLVAVLAAACAGQTLTGGAISGRVLADKGNRGLANVRVYAVRTAPSMLTTAQFPTASDGSFQLSPLAAGTYRLCVTGAAGFSANCMLPEVTNAVTVNWGQTTANVTVRLKDSSQLVVRLNDPNGHLDRANAGRLPVVTFLLGDGTGNQFLMTATRRDATGHVFELDIPLDQQLSLTAATAGVVVMDEGNAVVPGNGKAYGFQHQSVQAANGRKGFVFTVVGPQ